MNMALPQEQYIREMTLTEKNARELWAVPTWKIRIIIISNVNILLHEN